MTTLSKRATPAQQRIMRAIEGAVKNVADTHPNWSIHERLASSIAKRATGTLSAQWPEVLAAQRVPSDGGETQGTQSHRHRYRRNCVSGDSVRGASHSARRSPLRKLWLKLAKKVRPAKNEGKTERAETLVEVLRMIDETLRASEHPSDDRRLPRSS